MKTTPIEQSLNVEQPIKRLMLPREHIVMRLVRAMITYLFGSRGSFKTSRAIPLYMVECVYEMPRSTGTIIGLSFEHLGDNTIPPLLQALEEIGFYENQHWVYGRKPPAHWPKPYLGVLNDKYDHRMTWHNGTSVAIVSLAKKASANGVSAQWGIFDEAKFMEAKQLIEEIFPIFRGNEQYFQYCAAYLSKLFTTDKEADPVQLKWLLDQRKLVDQEMIDIVLTLALQLNDLKLEYYQEETTKTRQRQLLKEIRSLEADLSVLRNELVYVAEISADDIRPILGDKWYKDKQRSSSERVWNVSFLNRDPETAGEVFYPQFSMAEHTYADGDIEDYNELKPLIITPDYQHAVSPITIAQLHSNALLYIDEVYTLSQPKINEVHTNGNGSKGELDEALDLFVKRYSGHRRKVVYYVYNAQAKGKQVNADRYYERVCKKLKKHKWRVVKVFIGKQQDHYSKYTDTIDWMKHTDPELPVILINRDKCPKLVKSIQGAGTKMQNGETKKDKKYENTEHFPDLDQSETTHFSDCFDDTNQAVFKQKKIKSYVVGNTVGFAQ